jgi:hypothetical protein
VVCEEPIIRPKDSLVRYKSFNTLCAGVRALEQTVDKKKETHSWKFTTSFNGKTPSLYARKFNFEEKFRKQLLHYS